MDIDAITKKTAARIGMGFPPEQVRHVAETCAQWFRCNDEGPDLLLDAVMRSFGAASKVDAVPGTPDIQGKFFVYEPQKNPRAHFREATAADLAGARHVCFFGIDTDGMKYLGHYMKAAHTSLLDGVETPLITYHYDSTPRARGNDVKTLYANEGHFSAEAARAAGALFKARKDQMFDAGSDSHCMFLTHSFGGVFGKMVMNALSDFALNEAGHNREKAQRAVSPRYGSLNFGVWPAWQAENPETMSPFLDIQKDSIELYFTSMDDLMPYKPGFFVNAYGHALRPGATPEESAPDYCILRHEGTAPKKFLTIFGPENIPNVDSKNLRNLGGHGFSHFLDVVAGSRNTPPRSELLGMLAKEALETPHSFDPEKFLPKVKVMPNQLHRKTVDEDMVADIVSFFAARVLNESGPWKEAGKKHPFMPG